MTPPHHSNWRAASTPITYRSRMKQMILMSTLLLAATACGPTPPTPDVDQTGTITLSFYKVGEQGIKQQDLFSDRTTNIRLRVSNASNGFYIVKDVPVSQAGSIDVQVPSSTGYVVEAVSYSLATPSSTAGTFFKEGQQAGINVAPNAVEAVNLVLSRPKVTMTLPASVTAGAAFPATVSGVSANFTFCWIQPSNTPFPTTRFFTSGVMGVNGTHQLNAPEYGDGTMYVYMNCVMPMGGKWATSETSLSYLYNYVPNVDLNEAPFTSAITASNGSVKIGIGY